jgi:outer membrane immunogenic protein
VKKILIAATALVGWSVTPVPAADLAARPYTKAPAITQVYDWTGFYLGVNAGLGLGRDLTRSSYNPFVATTHAPTNQLGYNKQFGNWVLGLETDIQAAGMKSHSCIDNCNLPAFAIQQTQKLDWFGTARGRAGLATGPVLSYVTGGFAYGGGSTVVTQSNALFVVPINTATFSDTRTGWTLGSGVEASLGGNWTAKAEYLYLDLGTRRGSVTVVNAFAGGTSTTTTTSRLQEHIYRAGLNYRFGGSGTYTEPTANWAGLYLGGNAGSATARNVSTLSNNFAVPNNPVERFDLMPNGYIGGGQIGYNWQATNWVFGLEGDIQGSTQRDNKSCLIGCVTIVPGGPDNVTIDQRMTWLATARGRVGYSLGATLFYGTAGAAFGEVKSNITETSTPVVTTAQFKQTRTGWTAGGGIESPLELFGWFGKNWTAKTEYLYVDLGSASGSFVSVPQGGTVHFSTRVTEHIFRSGLNYHLNAPVVAKY